MRLITYFTCGLALVFAAMTATAAVYGWEAEDFDTIDGDGPAVFDVPLTTTAGDATEYTIAEARGDQFIGSEDASGLTGVVTRGISLPSGGDWYLWMRAIGPPGADNSFFWSIDGPTATGDMEIIDFNEAAVDSRNYPLGDPPPEGAVYDWMWFRFTSRGTQGVFEGRGDEDPPVPINLSAGFHAVNIAIREDGAFLDMVHATTDAAFDANATDPPAGVEPTGKLATTWAGMKSSF